MRFALATAYVVLMLGAHNGGQQICPCAFGEFNEPKFQKFRLVGRDRPVADRAVQHVPDVADANGFTGDSVFPVYS